MLRANSLMRLRSSKSEVRDLKKIVIGFSIASLILMLIALILGLSQVLDKASGYNGLTQFIEGAFYQIMPLAVGIILGFAIWKKQKEIESARRNLDSCNELIVKLISAKEATQSFKHKYINNDSSCPGERVFLINEYTPFAPSLEVDIASIGFISTKTFESEGVGLLKLFGIIVAYNQLVSLWRERDELAEILFASLRDKYPDWKTREVDENEILEIIGRYRFQKLVTLTQMVVLRTDKLLIYFVDFLEGFPRAVKKSIKYSAIEGYGNLLVYTQVDKSILKEWVEVDYKKMGEILGSNEKEAKEKFGV